MDRNSCDAPSQAQEHPAPLTDKQIALGCGLKFVRSGCPRCGATTDGDVAAQCRPSRDETGEADCPGTYQPTPESLAEMDAAIGRLMAPARDGASQILSQPDGGKP